jgi:hypothetical protein
MRGAALVLGEVIAFVVSDQVDNRAFGSLQVTG